MSSSIWFDTIYLGSFIVHIKESQNKDSKKMYFLFNIENSVDCVEMSLPEAFFCDLYCMPKHPFTGFMYIKGYI